MIILDNGIEIKSLSDFGFRELIDHSNPSSVAFERNLQYIPGRDSPWDFGVNKKGKDFEIPCKIYVSDEEVIENKINEFNAFVFNMHREPREMKMWFDYESDKFIYVQLKQSFEIDRSSRLKYFSLPFTSLNGKKYARSDEYDPKELAEYGKVKDGDFYRNSDRLNWIFRRSYTGFFNYSPYTTSIQINIQGTIKNASVLHQQTGVELTLPNMTNGTMLIDTKQFAIFLGDSDLAMESNLNFFEIVPGNNSFLFKSDSPNAKVILEWFHEF